VGASLVTLPPELRHVHEHSHADGERHRHQHGDADIATDANAVAIEIEHLHFAYPDGFEALHGVDLRVDHGEKLALIGPNGAGKSTLMLHLNGIHTPSHGTVRIGGRPIDRSTIKEIRAEVGLVFQDPDDQLFSPTVFEDVAFGPIHLGYPLTEIHDRVERALEAVGMSGTERRIPSRLSLGQRKRVALATVLSMDPSVLVFDEPSAGLDPRGRRELIDLLQGLDQTVIVATHDMRLVEQIFPRTIVMDDGRIVGDAPTGAILGDEAFLRSHGLERP
jgi:cobalt transport protein ATP-binding subunit